MRQDVVSKHAKINAVALRTIIWMIMQHPCDYYELMDATGLGRATIRRWLAPWRKKSGDIPRLVHIAEWHPDSRGAMRRPAFFYAPGKADVKPTPAGDTERKRQYRAARRVRDQQVAALRALAGVA